MKIPFDLQDKSLSEHLQHIVYHPADPLYNGFVITGDTIGGKVALRRLQAKLSAIYPAHEVLYYTNADLAAFIKPVPEIFLQHFHKFHPDLMCVLIEDLSVHNLNDSEQNKLALFLKSLTQHHIQVAVSTNIIARMGQASATHLTGELWSWFNSGREYHLPYGKVLSLEYAENALSLTEDTKHCKLPFAPKRWVCINDFPDGTLYKEPFREYKRNMTTKIGLIWNGVFYENSQVFPRAICPTCNEDEMVLYECNTEHHIRRYCLKFWCPNCEERFATHNMPDYFEEVKNYVLAHSKHQNH